MKVAIASKGKELSSELDPRFGRAAFFAVVDTDSDTFEVVDNSQNLNAMQGAGIQAAQNVANLGVQAVVAGNVGPKAFQTLSVAGVKVYLSDAPTVKDTLEKLKAGELQEAPDANVAGHWM